MGGNAVRRGGDTNSYLFSYSFGFRSAGQHRRGFEQPARGAQSTVLARCCACRRLAGCWLTGCCSRPSSLDTQRSERQPAAGHKRRAAVLGRNYYLRFFSPLKKGVLDLYPGRDVTRLTVCFVADRLYHGRCRILDIWRLFPPGILQTSEGFSRESLQYSIQPQHSRGAV